MILGDTIAAIASAERHAARAIVRVSGPGTVQIVKRLTELRLEGPGVFPVRARFDCAGERVELPMFVLVYRGPRSYTGEDCAEFVMVGNPYVAQGLLESVVREEGARLAQPGEFTARAFLNGKMSAEQAEGVGALIGAHTDEEAAAARRLLSGESGSAYRAMADDLAMSLALVEAGIDFSDQEDVVAIEGTELLRRLEDVHNRIGAIVNVRAATERRRIGVRVLLVGAPNAGKSTLFNALLGRVRAVVSDVAGTTRDVLEEEMKLNELCGAWSPQDVILQDAPGIDDLLAGRSEPDSQAVQAARRAAREADVLVYCDPSGVFDRGLFEVDARQRLIRIRTKADLAQAASVNEPGDGGALAICALDGFNLDALRRAIADAASGIGGDPGVLPRHRQALIEAHEQIAQAMEVVADQGSERGLAQAELVAGCLRGALNALGSISGQISPDDVIGRIFSTFCIGK